MFQTTFLGHQGWLFSSERGRLLVDPLLVEPFGHRGVVGTVYPPRVWTPSQIPAVDAVLITHEHEDHFNVPSLTRLSRNIPIYLPARASVAARGFLEDLGFSVHLLEPDRPVQVGALELHVFGSDNATFDNSDEWEVMPFLVRHLGGDGSFFTSVDVEAPPDIVSRLKPLIPTPGLWCFTNNHTDFSFQAGGDVHRSRPSSVVQLTSAWLTQYSRLCFGWRPPAAVLTCGGGVSFSGERSWMNRHAFPSDSERMCRAFQAVVPEQTTLASLPGQTVTMEGGKVVGVSSASFVAPEERARWPDRVYENPEERVLDEYEPASGVKRFDPALLPALEAGLAGLADFLYARREFRALYSLSREALQGRVGTLALVLLREDEDFLVFRYEPQACRFAAVDSEDPFAEYIVGMECWATDLLSVLTVRFGPAALSFGRSRTWSFLPPKLRFEFDQALWVYMHPLRHPAAYLRLYRDLLAEEAPTPPWVERRVD